MSLVIRDLYIALPSTIGLIVRGLSFTPTRRGETVDGRRWFFFVITSLAATDISTRRTTTFDPFPLFVLCTLYIASERASERGLFYYSFRRSFASWKVWLVKWRWCTHPPTHPLRGKIKRAVYISSSNLLLLHQCGVVVGVHSTVRAAAAAWRSP